MFDRNIDNTEPLDSSSRFVHHSAASHTGGPRHEARSTSDLPFRAVEWGRSDNDDEGYLATRLTSQPPRRYEHRPIYAPTPLSTKSTNHHSSTPRYIPPFSASKIPSYVRSPSAPSYVKRRSESRCSDDDEDVASPSHRIKTENCEGGAREKAIMSPPPPPRLLDARASTPSERQSHRSEKYALWRKKMKEQKMRLRLDAERYIAEQEELFRASRGEFGGVMPMPVFGCEEVEEGVAVKQEKGEDGEVEVIIKQEKGEEE
ncbi:MAG: hypothetical protein Q9168_008367 [Polycauliona sp. 1 TL-2023]